jgi:hypothetical protein
MNYNKGKTPKGLPIRIWHPVCPDLPEELPDTVHLYTIPLKEMDEADIGLFVGVTTDPQKDLIEYTLSELTEYATMVDFLNKLVSITYNPDKFVFKDGLKLRNPASKRSVPAVTRAIRKHLDMGLISSSMCKTAIKWDEIINDKSKVDVFWQYYLRKDLALHQVYIILKRIYKAVREARGGLKIILLIDEIRDICPADIPRETPVVIYLRDRLLEMVSEARGFGMSIIVASQSPITIYKHIFPQLRVNVIYKLDDPGNIDYLLKGIGYNVPPEEFNAIRMFDPIKDKGACLVVDSTSSRETRFIPPLFHLKMSKDKEKEFFRMAKKNKIPFYKTRDVTNAVFEELERAKEVHRQKVKEKKIEKQKELLRKSRLLPGEKIMEVFNQWDVGYKFRASREFPDFSCQTIINTMNKLITEERCVRLKGQGMYKKLA